MSEAILSLSPVTLPAFPERRISEEPGIRISVELTENA
jgi:hypothetical protein